MSEPQKTYEGGCQCGRVRYDVRLDLSQPVISCNCSMCGRAGTLLTFVPASQFTLKSGGESLTNYQFNKHVIHHLFCSVCGIKSFARGVGRDGGEQVAVNVRCLDDVDLDALKIQKFDGRAR
ncbi:MAG TPA: GFA family protein [Polyangia bacterium]|nr:GFA family protein [Polyangia bacterium]